MERVQKDEEAVAAPVAPGRLAQPKLLGAIGNRAIQRMARGTPAQRALLQRYITQQAATVIGPQFEAQVKQASGSFRNAGGVVVQTGPPTTQLRVSEDGQMAVEDTNLTNRQAKVFYATSDVFSAANKALKKHKSEYLLYADQKKAITVTAQDGTQVRLDRILPRRSKIKLKATDKGLGLVVGQVCDEVARRISGSDPTLTIPKLEKAIGLPGIASHEYRVARWFVDRINHGEAAAQLNVATDGLDATGRDRVTQDYMQVLLNAPIAASAIARELGVNEFADPRVGQVFGSVALGVTAHGVPDYANGGALRTATTDTPGVGSGYVRNTWTTHYGAVVAESAGNKMTLENYGRKGEDPANVPLDPIYYFQMYGPTSNATQTWHGQWTAAGVPVVNPLTMVYG